MKKENKKTLAIIIGAIAGIVLYDIFNDGFIRRYPIISALVLVFSLIIAFAGKNYFSKK